MNKKRCPSCKEFAKEWNLKCKGCGFTLVLEPTDKVRKRYLRAPSLGALLFTQAWAAGARMYIWLLLSFIPIVGVAVLIILTLFGRRLAWTYGGWTSWQEFEDRMRLLDIIGVIWVIILLLIYFTLRQ